MDDAGSDRNVDGSVREVITHAIEHPAKFRNLSGHARELPIRRVDDLGKNEEDEGKQAGAFVVKQSTAGDASDRAQNTEMRRRQSKDACSSRDDPAAGPKKEDVGQLLDFDGFESEAPRKSRLAVTKIHKAHAITRFRHGCNASSLLHTAPPPLKSIPRGAD